MSGTLRWTRTPASIDSDRSPQRSPGALLEPRLLRVATEDDARVVAALTGVALPDSSVRGWAAILPPADDATSQLIRELGSDYRIVLVSGPAAIAVLGDLPSLRWLGRSLAASLHPPASTLGETVRDWAERSTNRPAPLVLRGVTLDWSRPVVMGVVNVTPDSFSDGGRFLAPERAIEHGLRLVAEGADILDVGGESTRPRGATYGEGARTVADGEEIARVVPVIRGLRQRTAALLSIDTRKSAVASAALSAGADLVNDVSGLLHDPALAEVVRVSGAGLVLMHTPRDIEALAHEAPSEDIVGDVLSGLGAALRRAGGIAPERILVDPGIGFGKTAAHNFYLLRHLETLRALGHPILVGASRKASIARAATAGGEVPPADERLGASLGAAVSAYLQGAQVIRAHDVRETVQALRVAAAIRGAVDAGSALSS